MATNEEVKLLVDESIKQHQQNAWYYEKFLQHNPGLAPKVVSYLAGAGPRPSEADLGENHYARGLVLAKDASVALSPVTPPPDPEPEPPPSGSNVTLVNQTWKPSGNGWSHPVVDVRITATDPRRDSVHLSGSGTVGRFYSEQHSGDVFKVHTDVNGIVIGSYDQQSEFYSKEFYGSVHQDGIQAMGGKNCKFVGFYMQKDVGGNSHVFYNMGAGDQSLPTDHVVEFSVINGYRGDASRGGGRPFRIGESLRCGGRHCLVIYAENPGVPLWMTAAAQSPVIEDMWAMTHAQWDSIGGNANGPRHKDLWNADGSHKSALDQLIAQGKVRKLPF